MNLSEHLNIHTFTNFSNALHSNIAMPAVCTSEYHKNIAENLIFYFHIY